MMKVNAANLFAGALMGADPLIASCDTTGEVAVFRKLFQKFAQLGDGPKNQLKTANPEPQNPQLCSPLAATLLGDSNAEQAAIAQVQPSAINSAFPTLPVEASGNSLSAPLPTALPATCDCSRQALPAIPVQQPVPTNPFFNGVTLQADNFPGQQPAAEVLTTKTESAQQFAHSPDSPAQPLHAATSTTAAPQATRATSSSETMVANPPAGAAKKISKKATLPGVDLSGAVENLDIPIETSRALQPKKESGSKTGAAKTPEVATAAAIGEESKAPLERKLQGEPAPSESDDSLSHEDPKVKRRRTKAGPSGAPEVRFNPLAVTPHSTTPVLPAVAPSTSEPQELGTVVMPRVQKTPPHSIETPFSPELMTSAAQPASLPLEGTESPKPAAEKKESDPSQPSSKQESPRAKSDRPSAAAPVPARFDHPKLPGPAVPEHPAQAVATAVPTTNTFSVAPVTTGPNSSKASPRDRAQMEVGSMEPPTPRPQAARPATVVPIPIKTVAGSEPKPEQPAAPADYGTSPPPTPPSLEQTPWARARNQKGARLTVVRPGDSQDPNPASADRKEPSSKPSIPAQVVRLTLVTPFPAQKTPSLPENVQTAWPRLPEDFGKAVTLPATLEQTADSSLMPKALPVPKALSLSNQAQPTQSYTVSDLTRHLVGYSQKPVPSENFPSRPRSVQLSTAGLSSSLEQPADSMSQPPNIRPVPQTQKPGFPATPANAQVIPIQPNLAQPRPAITQTFSLHALEAAQKETRQAPSTNVTSYPPGNQKITLLDSMTEVSSQPVRGQISLARNIFESSSIVAPQPEASATLFKDRASTDLFPTAPQRPTGELPSVPQLTTFKPKTSPEIQTPVSNQLAPVGTPNANVEKLEKMSVEGVSRMLAHRLAKPDLPPRQRLELELDPDRLGALKIEISVDPVTKKVETHLIVAHESAREALEHQIPQLRQRLQDQGIHVESRLSLASENGNNADTHSGGRNFQGHKKSAPAHDLPADSEASSGHKADGNLYA